MSEAATGVGATPTTNTPPADPKVTDKGAFHQALDGVRLTINPDTAVASFGAFRQVIDKHMTLAQTAEAANAAEAGKPLKVIIEPKVLDGVVDEQEVANLRMAQATLGPQWRALAEPPSYQIGEAHLKAVITKAAAKLPPKIGRQLPSMLAMVAAGATLESVPVVGQLAGGTMLALVAPGELISARSEFKQFASELATARTPADEDRAADHLASCFAIVAGLAAPLAGSKASSTALEGSEASSTLKGSEALSALRRAVWAREVGLVREAGVRAWVPETGAVRIGHPAVADLPDELNAKGKPPKKSAKGAPKKPPEGKGQKSLPQTPGGPGQPPEKPPRAQPAPGDPDDDFESELRRLGYEGWIKAHPKFVEEAGQKPPPASSAPQGPGRPGDAESSPPGIDQPPGKGDVVSAPRTLQELIESREPVARNVLRMLANLDDASPELYIWLMNQSQHVIEAVLRAQPTKKADVLRAVAEAGGAPMK